ncbi:hypothetical protein LEP1GSC172_2214 [Leptospira noguchii]|uniref:Uncharacterized protein n=1 Tax=Leptospira noguchii TaxID=28182 RepID=M6VFH8_9LEPT|nr:hypothetical protein LEP1GSC172_2214 [Leptospira noguchii]
MVFRKRILSLSSCNLLIQTSYLKETFFNKTFSVSFRIIF